MKFYFKLFSKKITTPWRRLERRLGLSGTEADYVTGLAVLVLVTAGFLLTWYGVRYVHELLAREPFPENEVVRTVSATSSEMPCPYHRLLDGVCVLSEEDVAPPLTGIMIENSVEAWPLSGLASASVVYEAPAEGNIPRFLAVYADGEVLDKVGPVRSARPYYVDWAKEYGDIMYMHVGGSPEALNRIAADDHFFDLNEFFRGWYFWRSADRDAPHNVYTSSRLWGKARVDYGDAAANHIVTPWVFATSSYNCFEDCVDSIQLSFGSPAYEVEWKYNTSTGKYERYQANRLQHDEDGTTIVADTVIIQRVKAVVLDDIGRKKITTVGTGDAAVFRNGQVVEGGWQKESVVGRTEWLDIHGDPILLQAGKIWIEVVPMYNTVTWK